MYLLDTNILSLNFRGNPQVGNNLRNKSSFSLFLCSIVLSEAYFGIYNSPPAKESALVEYYDAISSSLTVLDFDLASAKIYSKLKFNLKKTGKTVQDFDLMIASICLANDLILVTNNTKHFQSIPDLKLQDWTK
jgi:tRNA(fMet)-specific endonuclease VapC